jgi:hypothetical protein
MLGWFKRKSYDKLVYAERLYTAFVDRQIGKLTPERLHIQNGMWAQYEAKALFYREAWCICAHSAVARKLDLFPVLAELDGLVQAKRAARGIHYPHDKLLEASFFSLDEIFDDPFEWGKDWLSGFRIAETELTSGAWLIADHWRRQFGAMKGAIENTRP